ncbi:winged helix-turn-helix transcriptional regulator [Streptomyces sp. NPDC001594]|uniref:winged helix-turn-helix transcriptional regulator n=1 Tax=Streptomyces sp. NPDC001594 TaxID=3364590 RepID=UPI00368BCBFF
MSRTTACTAQEDPGSRELCTVLDVLGRVSGKWSLGVLSETLHGPVRFSALERSLAGISRRILTLTLRELEEGGLLVRTVYPTVPPRVEYAATEAARELYERLTGLADWARRHPAATAAARRPGGPGTG